MQCRMHTADDAITTRLETSVGCVMKDLRLVLYVLKMTWSTCILGIILRDVYLHFTFSLDKIDTSMFKLNMLLQPAAG